MPKEPYMHAKRALYACQKSPIKEPYHDQKRPDTDMFALLRKVLVLSDRRQHLDLLRALLCGCSSPLQPSHPGAGTKAKRVPSADVGFYVGGSKGRELEAAAQCRIILATFGMASEGLDVAALNTLVLATPRADIEQSVGRILRYRYACR